MKKRILIYSFLMVYSFGLCISNVNASGTDFCVQTSSIWQLAGYALLIFKIIIPIIIIVLATIDFAKAVVDAKDNNLSNAAILLLKRMGIGIFIFFIPIIVSAIFKLLTLASDALEAGEPCRICLINPNSSDCDGYKATAKAQRNSNNP